MAVARHILIQSRKIGGGGALVVPIGAIALWTGTLATIPANWSLCDGTGGTPNLVARFVRGAPAATNPGTTGGVDSHSHASMTAAGGHTHTAQNLSHQHTVNSAGDHGHIATTTLDPIGVANQAMDLNAGAHQHTNNAATHSHTMDSTANHTHPISTGDGRPPYYEVAFIQAGVGASVALNLIIIWTGLLANIPAGWTLCDGGGGRPDLRSRFVRGVNTNVTNPGTTGGAATHLHTETAQAAHTHIMNNTVAHQHTFNAYTWTHSHNTANKYSTGATTDMIRQSDTGGGDHTHAASNSIDTHNHNPMGNDGGHTHIVNAASSLPAYYDVAYIINTGAAIIPQNGILIWTGLLANIPLGYNLCDGGGGRPDLRSKFARGSNAGVDPGGTGGSDTHTHTDQDAGAHNQHTQTAAGSHQHAATDSIGSHTHATTTPAHYSDYSGTPILTQNAAGAHSHTYNNEGSHNNHVLTDPGNHTHNNWSTDDGRPAYYEVAFIQKA